MQVVAYVASGQVAFLPDRRHVVLRRPAQGPFDLSEPDESLFDLAAFGSQIIHRHALSPFRFGSRFEKRRDVVFPVEILSSYAGERDQSPFPVRRTQVVPHVRSRPCMAVRRARYVVPAGKNALLTPKRAQVAWHRRFCRHRPSVSRNVLRGKRKTGAGIVAARPALAVPRACRHIPAGLRGSLRRTAFGATAPASSVLENKGCNYRLSDCRLR